MTHPKMLKNALEYARETFDKEGKNFHLACVAVRNDGAIVRSRNGWNSNVNAQHHAEGRCARKLDVGSTVYVARIRKDGRPALARPCSKCENLLRSKGVKKVIFTIDSSTYGIMDFEKETEKEIS